MFWRRLAASILGNTLAGKGVINADEGVREQVKFLMPPRFLTNFKIQRYEPKINLNLMVLIQEIIYLKQKHGDIYIKSWWVWINRNSLDSIICQCWKCDMSW